MSLPADACCPEHPDTAALTSCGRCGRFVCHRDAQVLLKGTFCHACAQRPEVNFVDTFLRVHEGQRDGWAWLLGVMGLLSLGTAGLLVPSGIRFDLAPGLEVAVIGLLVSFGALGIAFFLRVAAARWGLVLWLTVVSIVVAGFIGPWTLLLMVPPALLLASALVSVPTRLFFRLPVPVHALEREWRRRYDNPLARQATSWALLGALLPIFLPIALLSSLIALSRVDPTAQPPIGGRGQALTALVVATLAGLAWALVLVLGQA
jgi:hypothetical protein